jgi:putative transposase
MSRNGARDIKKSGLLYQRNEVKYSFLTRYKKTWPVRLMCRLLGVQSQNYYSYQKRQTDKPDDLTHQEVLEWVKDIAKFSDNTYVERHIQKVLNAPSFPVSRRKTAKLMKEAGVWVRYKKKYKVTTNSGHKSPFMTMYSSKTL